MKNYPNYLVSLNIAKELKIIGLKSKVYFYYINDKEYRGLYTSRKPENFNKNTTISIPVWEQVFDWFREKKIFGNVNQEWEYGDYNSSKKLTYFYVINDCRDIDIKETEPILFGGFDIFEEAREYLLNKLIELYENNI